MGRLREKDGIKIKTLGLLTKARRVDTIERTPGAGVFCFGLRWRKEVNDRQTVVVVYCCLLLLLLLLLSLLWFCRVR